MSMQMDACLKKEQIGTLFVRVGALEGGVGGGGGGPQGCPPQKVYVSSQKKTFCHIYQILQPSLDAGVDSGNGRVTYSGPKIQSVQVRGDLLTQEIETKTHPGRRHRVFR
jgi:hypothetical protein